MAQEITSAGLHARLAAGEPVLVVDVRSPEEFAAGHVLGAVNIPLTLLESDRGALSLERPIVTVCGKGGGRSQAGADALVSAGARDVSLLMGGTIAWAASGGRITKE